MLASCAAGAPETDQTPEQTDGKPQNSGSAAASEAPSATDTETAAKTDTPAPTSDTPAPTSDTPVPTTDTPVPSTETPVETPTPFTDPPALSEEFYGGTTDGLKIDWTFDDESGPSIAGNVTLSAENDDALGYYYLYFGDENGILPGWTWISAVRLVAAGEPVTVFNPTFLNILPEGARTVVATDRKGSAAFAYSVIPVQKLKREKYDSSFAALSDVHIFLNEHYNGDYNSINGDKDMEKAVRQLNKLDLEHISITGDLILSFTEKKAEIEAELAKSTSIIKTAKAPVYVVKGNHDKMVDETVWQEMTGCALDYWFESDGTYYIYMSLQSASDTGSNDTYPYGQAKVKWLKDLLKEAEGKRVMLFMHYPFNGYAGLIPGKTYGFTPGSPEEQEILAAIKEHGAVTVFNGHTHYDFQSSLYYPEICVSPLYGRGTTVVHVPSVAYPRDYQGNEISSESQCYIVDLCKDGIRLRGLDLTNGRFVPNAVWYIDTRKAENALTDDTLFMQIGVSAQLKAEKTYSEASFRSYNERVATVSADGTVTAVSAGKTYIEAVLDGTLCRAQIVVSESGAMTGSGTKDDPFVIAGADHFASIQEEMRHGQNYKGKYFVLACDIDLNESPDYAPMTDEATGEFAGILDGRGHVLKAKTKKNSASFAVPYFWSMTGTLMNIGFECEMGGCSSTSYIVARTMNGGTMVNCFVTGSMVASNVNTTVICGTSSNTKLQNIYINVSVTGTKPGSSESGISMKGSGKVGNIYYIANGCTPQFDETEVSSGEGVADLLNAGRAASAAAAGVEEELLCAWTEVEGAPRFAVQ